MAEQTQAPAARLVIAATDLSDGAKPAIERATSIARAHGAALEILHVLPPQGTSPIWLDIQSTMGWEEGHLRRAVEAELRIVAERIAATGIRARAHVCEGRPFAAIAARAASEAADLLVLGAHGEHGVLESFLGSTAERVLGIAKTPVLVVRGSADEDYRIVLAATDFSADSARAAKAARALFPSAELRFFHAYDIPFEGQLHRAGATRDIVERYRLEAVQEARTKLDEFAESLGMTHNLRSVLRGDAAARIAEHAGEVGADLIAVGAESNTGIAGVLLGGVSSRVLREARCDVLLARNVGA